MRRLYRNYINSFVFEFLFQCREFHTRSFIILSLAIFDALSRIISDLCSLGYPLSEQFLSQGNPHLSEEIYVTRRARVYYMNKNRINTSTFKLNKVF